MTQMTPLPVTDAADLTEAAVEWVMDVHTLSGPSRQQVIQNALNLCEAAQAILAELPPAAYAGTLKEHIALTAPLRANLDGERFKWRALKELIPSRHMLALRADRDTATHRQKRISA